MALTRNQRRKAKAHRDIVAKAMEHDAHNTGLVLARRKLVADNLSQPLKAPRSEKGMGNRSVYSPSNSHTGAYVARSSKPLDYLPKGSVAHGFNKG